MFEKCVKTGDLRNCPQLQEAGRLADGFSRCIESRSADDCIKKCLKECRGEGCGEACLGALNAAMGVIIAKSMIEIVEAAASQLNMDPITAAAWTFYKEVEKVEKRGCPEKEVMAWILAAAAVELYKHFIKALVRRRRRTQEALLLFRRVREVLLLMAPALAEAYQCAGKEVFKYLDSIKPLLGERAVKSIIREMRRGSVFVGGVLITFKPVKTKR